MRRRSPSLLVPAILLTAALLAGAAVLFAPERARACTITPQSIEEAARDARLVVVATVASAGDGAAVLLPEAYLKGAATGGQVRLAEYNAPGCDFPTLLPGQRVLVLLSESDGRLGWPTLSQLYILANGRAVGGRERADAGSEAELVAHVRALTDQYAVPATSANDGAAIDWGSTILPVGVTILVVFAIGLVLMRVWHRIDPS